MKRKEPEPQAAGNFTSQDSSAEQRQLATTLRGSKRPKLRESDAQITDPVPEAALERFADAGRRHLELLMNKGGWEGETALDHLLTRLTQSSISDRKPPPFTRADIKLVRKITGFDFSQAERVLRLREEICFLSRELNVEPADTVDALTARLVSEFDTLSRKRHRDDIEHLESHLERPAKRMRDSEESRPGKRSHSDFLEGNLNFNQGLSSSDSSHGAQNTPDASGPSKRRKTKEDIPLVSQNAIHIPQHPPQALPDAPANSSSESRARPSSDSLLSRAASTFKDHLLQGMARLVNFSPVSAPAQPPTDSASTSPADIMRNALSSLVASGSHMSPDSPMHSTDSVASESPASGSGGESPFHPSPFIPFGLSSAIFGSGFGASPGGAPASPFGSSRTRSRRRESSQNDPFDDASSLHSDDRSTTSSMMVHPSHSVDGNADDNIADDASSCASTSSIPSRKSRGGGGGDDASSSGPESFQPPSNI